MVLTCKMHHCLTGQPHKQEMAQEIPLHFTDSTMYNKKNAAVEFVLRKLSNRGWSRRCTQTQTDTSLPILIAFQWLPAGGSGGSLERG